MMQSFIRNHFKSTSLYIHIPKFSTDLLLRRLLSKKGCVQIAKVYKNPYAELVSWRACAQILLPVLVQEQEHCTKPKLIHQDRELKTRVLCSKFLNPLALS